jgi:hypothetical protein
MITSTYDLCLLIITIENGFGVVKMQTNNIIILANERFSALEKKWASKCQIYCQIEREINTRLATNL